MCDAVVEGEVETCAKAAKDALDAGLDAYETLKEGCAKGMAIMSDKYEKREAFVPEILASAEAMYAAIDILKPYIKVPPTVVPGKIILGVCEGDIHDIGKNIIKIFLEIAGNTVIDLGRDVRLKAFIEKVREEKPDILAMSALMTTSMLGMPDTIELLKDAGLRDGVKVIIGGAPISDAFAEKIGADGYGKDAPAALKTVEGLIKELRGN